MARVVLNGVGKRYSDEIRAVMDLDLDIQDGEFLVLVGPSGCGKTTTLRMIAGLEEISEGTLVIGGVVANDLPSRERDVAMVFQSYALYPHLNVFDNISFGLRLRKTPKREIQERVAEVADLLDLTDHLQRKPRNLSGGQRQRVAMGRAIVRRPQLFLMDEPLSNLDAQLRMQMRAEIARLQRDLGVTTIYVTHDQTEAMTLGDRVAVMKDGVLQQIGPPQELYDRPANLFVARFVGLPGMNTTDAVIEIGDGVWLVMPGQRLRLPDWVFEARPALHGYVGRQVVVGIRPEDMEDADIAGSADGEMLESVADLIESMGSDVLVHLPIGNFNGKPRSDSAVFVGRFSPHSTVFEGRRVHVRVDVTRLHFFDPDTGEAVWRH